MRGERRAVRGEVPRSQACLRYFSRASRVLLYVTRSGGVETNRTEHGRNASRPMITPDAEDEHLTEPGDPAEGRAPAGAPSAMP